MEVRTRFGRAQYQAPYVNKKSCAFFSEMFHQVLAPLILDIDISGSIGRPKTNNCGVIDGGAGDTYLPVGHDVDNLLSSDRELFAAVRLRQHLRQRRSSQDARLALLDHLHIQRCGTGKGCTSAGISDAFRGLPSPLESRELQQARLIEISRSCPRPSDLGQVIKNQHKDCISRKQDRRNGNIKT